MMRGYKALLRALAPPALVSLFRFRRNRQWFRGPYKSWAEAENASTGYADPQILEKVLKATLAVRDGKAAYEQDSVLFARSSTEFPLVAALLYVAARHEGHLRVLDFGGSLGSTYWRHRSWFPAEPLLKWVIVEQPHVVDAGRRHFEDDVLEFRTSIDEATLLTDPNVFLASTSVQYLRAPHEFIQDLIRRQFDYVLLHNLPLCDDRTDHIMVQDVPPEML